jgi:hypothetical protein
MYRNELGGRSMRFVVKALALVLATVSVPAQAALSFTFDAEHPYSFGLKYDYNSGFALDFFVEDQTGGPSSFLVTLVAMFYPDGRYCSYDPSTCLPVTIQSSEAMNGVGSVSPREFFGGGSFAGAAGTITFSTTDPDALFRVTNLTGMPGATISPLPEPAGWAMMIAGFGAVGVAMRRRIADRTKAQAVPA